MERMGTDPYEASRDSGEVLGAWEAPPVMTSVPPEPAREALRKNGEHHIFMGKKLVDDVVSSLGFCLGEHPHKMVQIGHGRVLWMIVVEWRRHLSLRISIRRYSDVQPLLRVRSQPRGAQHHLLKKRRRDERRRVLLDSLPLFWPREWVWEEARVEG